MTTLATSMFLGSDYAGKSVGGAVFDELLVKDSAANSQEMALLALGTTPYLGLAQGGSATPSGVGRATTHGTPGTQVSVAHGLGVKPSFVQIAPRGNGVVYQSAEADTTNFYVKGSAASVEFDWRAMA
jgi:hypothetical protein